MNRKGNIAWKSSDGYIIQVGQFRILHGNIKLDYCLHQTMQKM